MAGFIHSLIACICMLGAALTVGGCNYSYSKPDIAQLWGVLGAGVFDTLKAPESVDYYQVVAALPGTGPQTYQPANKVQALSAEDTGKLQKMLLNDKSYHFGVTKTCVFVPETAFRFKKGNKDVLVLVSMNCKQVKYDLGEQAIRLDIDPIADNFTEFLNGLKK